ncbi:MAG: hypothetical protein RIR95_1738 [Pseudomonadota bacterium]
MTNGILWGLKLISGLLRGLRLALRETLRGAYDLDAASSGETLVTSRRNQIHPS